MVIVTKDKLKTILNQFKIDYTKWGKGSAKTLDHLFNEIVKGECKLTKQNGGLVRIVEALSIIVKFEDKVLKEEKQVFKDGRVRKREMDGSVAEKLDKFDKDLKSAVVRALNEELSVQIDQSQIQPNGEKSNVTESMSYPGLTTNIKMYKFTVELNDLQYDPSGYSEHQEDKSTYFVWESSINESSKNQKMKHIKKFNDSDEYVQFFHYKIIKKEPIEELEKYKTHRRLRVFYHKGVTCCKCGIKGTQIVHGINLSDNNTLHLNVCTDDNYPLTIDHIIPRSKGGSNRLENLRTMCCLCNWERGNDEVTTFNKDKTLSRKYPKHLNHSDLKVGDIVYKRVNDELLGEIVEILPNEKHPRKATSCRIKERDKNSLYTLNSLYKKES